MPGRDQTGPIGRGKRTGRGLGICGDVSKLTEVPEILSTEKSDDVTLPKYGLGRGGIPCGRGRRRNLRI